MCLRDYLVPAHVVQLPDIPRLYKILSHRCPVIDLFSSLLTDVQAEPVFCYCPDSVMNAAAHVYCLPKQEYLGEIF